MEAQKQQPCPECDGCGQIANDDARTPWKYWAALPMPSAAAVTLGLVKPLPCPGCGGSGVAVLSK